MAPAEARTIVSSHPEKVRMLVLETDETHPETQKEKGSFGNVLDSLLKEAGEEHEPKLEIETMMQYVVESDGGKVPEAWEITEDMHAVLITGSVYDAHGDEEWIHKLMRLIKRAYLFFFPHHRLFSILDTGLIATRNMGSAARYQVYRHMLWTPDSLPGIGIKSRAESGR
jgi:hypothetical protein